jgi:hypothetical protein
VPNVSLYRFDRNNFGVLIAQGEVFQGYLNRIWYRLCEDARRAYRESEGMSQMGLPGISEQRLADHESISTR